MVTVCQKIDTVFLIRGKSLTIPQLLILTELEYDDLAPTLKELVAVGLLAIDASGRFHRSVQRAEGF